MSKVNKKICLLISLILCISVCAILGVKNKETYKGMASTSKCEVWCAPSTIKIRRDEVNFGNKKPCELVYNAVKGEYESYQLLMTAKDNISSYYLDVADLTDGNGNTIKAKNITVYNEYYTKVDITSNNDAKVGGYYPDALVPIDLAKNLNELKIENGNNGALWITIHVPTETVAGTYTSEFKLTVDGEVIKVPVSLKVYDYVLTEESHLATLFNLWDSGLTNGEKNSTVEMREQYYEFFLDYRINLDTLPIDSMETSDFISQAKKYANDPRVTNYDLPWKTIGGCFYDGALFQKFILALAENSTEELNLLKKAAVYFVDEPEGNNAVDSAISLGREFKVLLQDTLKIIDDDTKGKYDEFKTISNYESYVLNIRNVITCNFGEGEMNQLYNTWCPCLDKWYTASQIEANEKYVEKLGANLWWYGCMSPKDPYPQYHIDGALLSSRALNWLAQGYGIKGNLYWGVSAENNTDIYDKPLFRRNDVSMPSGDGYLCYPGFKYGYHGPLPSMRLMSIRDGMEEYELLYALEQKCASVYEGINSRKAVHNIYSNIHDCIKTTKDIDLFDTTRKALLSISEMNLNGDVDFVFNNIVVNQEEKVAELRINLNSSKCNLKINGEEIAPQSINEFVYSFDISNGSAVEISVIDKATTAIVTTFTKEVG